jgi:hypothetical protein
MFSSIGALLHSLTKESMTSLGGCTRAAGYRADEASQ